MLKIDRSVEYFDEVTYITYAFNQDFSKTECLDYIEESITSNTYEGSSFCQISSFEPYHDGITVLELKCGWDV